MGVQLQNLNLTHIHLHTHTQERITSHSTPNIHTHTHICPSLTLTQTSKKSNPGHSTLSALCCFLQITHSTQRATIPCSAWYTHLSQELKPLPLQPQQNGTQRTTSLFLHNTRKPKSTTPHLTRPSMPLQEIKPLSDKNLNQSKRRRSRRIGLPKPKKNQIHRNDWNLPLNARPMKP